LQDLKKALELSRQEYDYSQLDEPVVPENEESTPAGTFLCPFNQANYFQGQDFLIILERSIFRIKSLKSQLTNPKLEEQQRSPSSTACLYSGFLPAKRLGPRTVDCQEFCIGLRTLKTSEKVGCNFICSEAPSTEGTEHEDSAFSEAELSLQTGTLFGTLLIGLTLLGFLGA
jgi:hypothetical protein